MLLLGTCRADMRTLTELLALGITLELQRRFQTSKYAFEPREVHYSHSYATKDKLRKLGHRGVQHSFFLCLYQSIQHYPE